MYKHLLPLLVLAPVIVFSQSNSIGVNDAGITLDTQRIVIANSAIISKPPSTRYVFRLKEHVAPAVLMFLAGTADGLNQVVSYRYAAFKKAFPQAHDYFWSPKI